MLRTVQLQLLVLLVALTVASAGKLLKDLQGIDATPFEEPGAGEEELMKSGRAPGPAPLILNRVNFEALVKRPALPSSSEQWAVLFCVEWWVSCQDLRRGYRSLAATYSQALNQEELFAAKVHFAEVDCATDKALCNLQKVNSYPQVNHYSGGELIASWEGHVAFGPSKGKGPVSLERFLVNQFSPASQKDVAKRRPLVKGQAARARLPLLILATLGLVAWFLSTGRELLQAAREALRRTEEPQVSQDLSKPAALTATQVPAARAKPSIFPEEWVRERRSIEL